MSWTAPATASTSCWSTCAGASCHSNWTSMTWCALRICTVIIDGMRLQQYIELHAHQGTRFLGCCHLQALHCRFCCFSRVHLQQASLHRLGSALDMSDAFWRALALHPAAKGIGGVDGGALCGGGGLCDGGGGGGEAGLKGILKHDNGGSNGTKRKCAASEPGSDVPPPIAPRAKAYRRYHAKVVVRCCLLPCAHAWTAGRDADKMHGHTRPPCSVCR